MHARQHPYSNERFTSRLIEAVKSAAVFGVIVGIVCAVAVSVLLMVGGFLVVVYVFLIGHA